MQFSIASILLVVSAAAARSCNQGGVYCGQSLLNIGNYHDHIVRVLQQNGQATDQVHIVNSIFGCLSHGELMYEGFCWNGCGGVGSTNPDYCL